MDKLFTNTVQWFQSKRYAELTPSLELSVSTSNINRLKTVEIQSPLFSFKVDLAAFVSTEQPR